MQELDDIALLKQFAENGSEPAFAEIVSRHVNLVYSAALRKVGDAHAAQEISQAVFIILARKAQSLGARTILSGWLHQTTRLTAANFLRGEIRRQKREQEAFMQSTLNEEANEMWRQIAPILDDAISKLGVKDRDAIVLRYFENKSLGEVGAAMGASEDAAKMRVNRALEKLRKIFSKRGVTLSAALIAGAVSASSVQAAPVGLAATISTTAVKGSAVAASTLTLMEGTLKLMAWTKMQMAIVIGLAVFFAGGLTWIAPQWIREWRDSRINFQVEGTLDFSIDGKPGAHKDFVAYVKSDKWLIHFPIKTNGIDYQEDAFDGENVYRYIQFQKDITTNSSNSSGGTVEANDIPDLGGSTDQVTPIWLAYGSAHYFEGIIGNKMKSFFFVNRPSPELQQGPYMEAEWKRSANSPFVPSYIYFQKLNERYQVLQFTNFDGLSVPSEFLEEYFGIGHGTTNEPFTSIHGFLTKISKLNTDQNFRPQLDGRTYTDDRRFPGNAAQYINVSTNWFETNSPEWQALLKMYDAKAGGLVWPRNHVEMTWPN
jgi:RNA polymerase sigma factor (sigma-70 family)